VRPSTGSLVRSLDFRAFAVAASGLYSTEASERAISESFKALPRIFPRLICLLIDGHPELDPGSLVPTATAGKDGDQQSLQLLDLGRCPHQLATRYFSSALFRDLVYLDISFIPGSVSSAVQSSLNPGYLPELRVLKVRGREMDDTTAALLFRAFKRQLWSLDISDNKLTDSALTSLVDLCFPLLSFRSDARFETEGKLVNPREIGSITYGSFQSVEESDLSATFRHPERYIADPPPYVGHGDLGSLHEWQMVRAIGTERRRDDSVDAVRQILLNDAVVESVSSTVSVNRHLRSGQGITHLYLNGNHFSTSAIQKLLRATLGKLEHLECDSCRFQLPKSALSPSLPKSIRVHGMFGAAHLLRPVFSSNLRSLRLHHSVVTQIPNVEAKGLSPITAHLHAETIFKDRIRMAYPQPFVPDLNPRLVSLTLIGIPARSIGPLISALTTFLDQVTAQQDAISTVSIPPTRHGSSVLSGLQHIRLELEPDYSDDSPSMFAEGDDNFDELLSPANDAGSSFREAPRDITTEQCSPQTSRPPRSSSQYESSPLDAPISEFTHVPGREHVTHRVDASDSWNGNVFSVPVWVGTGVPGPHPAVNAYMASLQDRRMHAGVGPAMPYHVAAGVPSGAYVFNVAWDAMCFPAQLPQVNRGAVSGVLRDVATAIREYRQRTKGTRRHWNGRLELVRTEAASRCHASEYWR
jgi:hypothetical protein